MSPRSSLRHPTRIAAVLFIFLLTEDSLTRWAAAGQYLCPAVRDNTIFAAATGTSNSNGIGTWFAGGKNGTDIQRGLIQFDLTQVPAGSTVTSATLSLYVIGAPNQDYTNTRYFWLNALQGVGTPSWGEGSSDASPSGQGQGVAAATGDATWLVKSFGTASPWPAGNGALGPDPVVYPDTSLAAGSVPGVTTVPTPLAPLLVQWTKSQATDQMVVDIQAWINGTMPNDGWVVLGEEATAAQRSKRQFASHEDAIYQPILMVNTVPEPSTWLLCLIASVLLAGYARRSRRRAAAGAG